MIPKRSKLIQRCIDKKWKPILKGTHRNDGIGDCILCQIFMYTKTPIPNTRCALCPLYIQGYDCCEENSLYSDFEVVDTHMGGEAYQKAAQNMIDMLEKVKKIYEEKGD